MSALARRIAPGGTALRELWPLGAGVVLLAFLWGGPLPDRAEGSFAAHMVMHMGVMAIASPLLALGLLRVFPSALGSLGARMAVFAAFAEFAVVWMWHAPALHDAARRELPLLLLEQGSFLAVGLLLWTSALATGGPGRGKSARAAGVAGLFLTSMHMTLLGALLLFAARPLYACGQLCSPLAAMTPLEDQQAGGAIMLAVGGAAYLLGALAILATVLAEPGPERREGAPR